MSQELRSALDALARDPTDAEGWETLHTHLSRRAAVKVPRADWREDIAADVLIKVLERIGRAEWAVDHPAAYLDAMLLNAFRGELRRREGREEELDPSMEAVAPTGAPLPEGEPLRALLEVVFQDAIQARRPRWREGLQQDWEQLQATAFGRQQLVDIIEAVRDDEPWSTAANRVYKRHERLREALHQALDRLQDAGKLDGRQASLAREALKRLVYCQKSRSRRIQKDED